LLPPAYDRLKFRKKREMKYFSMIVLAMLAFASNSILCRMALGEGAIDAASFTSIRLLSGALMLALILGYRNGGFRREKINLLSALMLFSYAICFSFSYVNLATGTGALILFGTVQLGLMLSGLLHGERPSKLAWLGIVLASAGLVYLLLPGVSAPPLSSALLMIAAGAAWSVYTIRGKSSSNPLASTGWNFIGTVPLALLTGLVFYADRHISSTGAILAMVSGALASALGYVIWYSLLPRISRTKAATVQLSVPVIAAFGGVVLLAEPLTSRLLVAGTVVLGGVYLTIRASMAKA
jgi:drug/metabolite transporter (DMT)-like permease